MNPAEIQKVQAYLRKLFGNDRIEVVAPTRKGGTVELTVRGEHVGTIHRDDEDGDVSYAISLVVLAEDLG